MAETVHFGLASVKSSSACTTATAAILVYESDQIWNP